MDEISPLLHAHMKHSLIIHTEATDKDPYAGIVVLINNRLTLLEHTILLPGRLLNFKVRSLKKCYNITAVYGYTSKNASQDKMKLMTEQLSKYHKTSDNNVILGDFSFVENDLDRTNQTKSG